MWKTAIKFIAMLCWLVSISIQADTQAFGDEMGPLHVKNRYPPHLMFLTPSPESPRLLEQGRFAASLACDYTSVHIDKSSDDWSALMDMELMVMDVSLTYGLFHRAEISVNMPWIRMHDGYLDDLLDSYHNQFGFPNYNREKRPSNEFDYDIQKDRESWFDADPGGWHLGDSTISAKLMLLDGKGDRCVAASLLCAIKIPTGNASRGFGSGRSDQGVFFLTQYDASPLILYLNPGYIFLSDPETEGADIDVQDVLALFAGFEYEMSDTWSVMGQLNHYTSPFRQTHIEQLDQNSLEVALGFSVHMFSRAVFELAFCEDLTYTAPDFTVHGGFIYKFGL